MVAGSIPAERTIKKSLYRDFLLSREKKPTAWLLCRKRKAFPCFEPELAEGDKTGKGLLSV
jgi:hypothetical protein